MGGQAFDPGVLQELVRQTFPDVSICLAGSGRLCRFDLRGMLGFAISVLQPTEVLLQDWYEVHNPSTWFQEADIYRPL